MWTLSTYGLVFDVFLLLGDDAVRDEEIFEISTLDGFCLYEHTRNGIEHVAVFFDDGIRFLLGTVDDETHFVVDGRGNLF